MFARHAQGSPPAQFQPQQWGGEPHIGNVQKMGGTVPGCLTSASPEEKELKLSELLQRGGKEP